MLRPDTVDYRVVRSSELTESDQSRIDPILWNYIEQVFPNVPTGERALFFARAARTRRNPNLAVGGSTIRARQSYARSVAVLAIHEGDIIGHLTVADNASAPERAGLPKITDTVVGLGERALKQYFSRGTLPGRDKPLIKSRYMYLGQPSLNTDVRDGVFDAAPSEASIVDGMIYAGAMHTGSRVRDHRRHPDQPISAYTYAPEAAWKQALGNASLHMVEGSAEVVYPFGPYAPTVEETWRISSLGAFEDVLANKDGGEALIARLQS